MVRSILLSILALGAMLSALAKDVYYVSGYFGTAGDDQHMTIVDADGKSVAFPIPATDTLVIRKPECTVSEAWVSDDAKQVPRLIRVETDFIFHSGVSGSILSGVTMEIAENVTATFSRKTTAQNVVKVGTVVFEGDGTVDLSGAQEVADPLTLSAGMKFKLPTTYTGGIVIADPENINPADYSDYVIYVDANGKTQLMPKKDVVAYVGATPYRTLQAAFDAAKPAGTIVMSAWPTANLPEGIKDAVQWQGTVTFSGTMPNGFTPANFGNASSTIEFKGVSGGYLVQNGSFAGALKLTNDGTKAAWTARDGYSYGEYNFTFGALTGDGDFVDDGGTNQQYSFGDASAFFGNVTVLTKRFVIGSDKHTSHSRIYIEKDAVANIAAGKKWDGQWAVRIDGTVKGSGTLASASQKQIYFGYEPNVGAIVDANPTIDLSEGALTVDSSCGVTFGNTLTLKNVRPGDKVLTCASKPTNMDTVTLKDETGVTPSFWSLAYENGAVKLAGDTKVMKGEETWTLTASDYAAFPSPLLLDLTDYDIGDRTSSIGETPHSLITLPAGTTVEQTQAIIEKIQLISPKWHRAHLIADGNEIKLTADTMTIFWNAWRGTFWEHYGQTDVNGNHGLGRALDGTIQAILSGDTVVFDKDHYTDENGQFAEQTAYWHYDENLYILNEVVPGTRNDWDLKVLQGVTLKMGLRGPRATGQNVISKLKIYVEEGSTLELGYWGNTHHYQGVLRDDVFFGGAGTITFGADLGPSLRAEGDVLVKNTDDPATVPTMNLNGKELVLCGKADAQTEIAVNLNGFGSIAAEKPNVHLTGDVDFGSTATIDATTPANMLTLDKKATFGSALTVKLTSEQVKTLPVQVLALGPSATLTMDQTDVRVLVNGSPVAAFYELYRNDEDGNLYVREKEGAKIAYGASAAEGYDFLGSLVTVTMDPAVADLPITVTVNGRDWTGTVGANGSGVVMIGDEDTFLESGTYDYTVHVGAETLTGSLFVGNKWFAADPTVGKTGSVTGGSWTTATPAVADGKYQLSETATFSVEQDKAAGELGVIEQVVTFASAVDDAALEDAADALTGAKGAITLAEGENGALCWKGYIGGEWQVLTTEAAAELGTHRIRLEYDRTAETPGMRYFIDGKAVATPCGEVTAGASGSAFTSVSYIGSGTLASLEGFVEDPALVEYAGVKYKSMEAAVASWKKAGKSGVITLLTNIFFAPEPGTYEIAKNGHSLYLTNDMIIEREEGTTIVVGFPQTVERYTNGLQLSGEAAPFIIDGEWLGKAIPWKRHSLIQAALNEKPDGSMFARWQSYLLGFAPEEVETANTVVRGVQTPDEDKLYVTDGQPIRDSAKTGVVVTRVLKEGATANGLTTLAEQPAATDDGLPVALDLDAGAVKYVQLGYTFAADPGQDTSLVPTTARVDPAEATFGILSVYAKKEESILSVPWLGSDGGDVAVADYVKTANLSTGDTLNLYDSEAKKFVTWTLQADGAWVGATRVAADGVAPAAEPTAGLPAGSALVLVRQAPAKPLYLFGQTGTVPTKTKVVANAYNLITPALARDVNLNDVPMTCGREVTPTTSLGGEVTLTTSSGGEVTPSKSLANDIIRVDQMTTLVYKEGKGWGRSVYNTTTHQNEFKTDCAVIKAGQGLVYISRGGSPTFVWVEGMEVSE